MSRSNAVLPALLEPLAARTRYHRDRFLAKARTLVGTFCFLAGLLGPRTSTPYDLVVRALGAGYLVASIWISVLIRARADSGSALQVSVCVLDLVGPSLICFFAGYWSLQALIIALFAVFAAACRWGLVETLGTATAFVLLAWLGRAVAVWGDNVPRRLLLAQRLSPEACVAAAFGLLLTAAVFGYLTQRHRELDAKISDLSRTLAKSSVVGFREALEPCLRFVGTLVEARRVVLVVQEERSGKAFLWNVGREVDNNGTVYPTELASGEHERYFFDAPAESWYTTAQARTEQRHLFSCVVVNARGQQLPDQYFSFSQAFFTDGSFGSLFAVSFGSPNEWSGRLFLLDCESKINPVVELSFLQALTSELLPSLYNVYLLQRVRSRARAEERLRIAHELHDGVVQSLIGIEMELDVLRRRATPGSLPPAQDIQRLQRLLQQQIVEARSFMERLKVDEMSPRQMIGAMADMVSRFQRETGIDANFAGDSGRFDLPARVCREVACILQEALTNVRKHSGARSVRVHFGLEHNGWRLIVADDGRGFGFSGRLSQADLDSAGMCPAVIKERARLIGAGLSIESRPGQGSRVEVFQQ